MEENKTGVWVRCMNGKRIRYNRGSHSSFNVGDIIEVDNDDVYAKFKIEIVELKNIAAVTATYTIKPKLRIDRTRHPYITTRFPDAESIEMDVYGDDRALIIVPPWYNKEQYRNQSIRSTETAITVTRKEVAEQLEIKTITIPADKIKTDVLSVSFPEPILSVLSSDQQKPITAISEAEKNWLGGFSTPGKSRIMHDDRGLSLPIPEHIDWNGEMSATLTFSSEKIDEIMNKFVGNEEEKDMYTEKLKDKIKKVIYVDKEMTVREPILDSNGKPLEKGGKPVTKAKFCRGMVKVVWNCGTETVAYTSRFDRFNREEGFKTCVLKYLFGNADAHDAVDFWTNKYVKYPSSCVEVTENLCKLEKILEKDKYRKDNQKGLPHAKFLRRIGLLSGGSVAGKLIYKNCDMKYVNEFKKLAKKYFPELKGKEIYVNGNKNDEIFVTIK